MLTSILREMKRALRTWNTKVSNPIVWSKLNSNSRNQFTRRHILYEKKTKANRERPRKGLRSSFNFETNSNSDRSLLIKTSKSPTPARRTLVVLVSRLYGRCLSYLFRKIKTTAAICSSDLSSPQRARDIHVIKRLS